MLGASQPAEQTEVLVVVADHICTITLNRPEKRNAFTVTMLRDPAKEGLAARFERRSPVFRGE